MSKTNRVNYRRGERGVPKTRQSRHVSVRSVRRDPLDLRKLARAVIAQALAEAAAEAEERAAADDRLDESSHGETGDGEHDD